MALIDYSLPEKWTDLEMDWTAPDQRLYKYYDALRLAMLERQYFGMKYVPGSAFVEYSSLPYGRLTYSMVFWLHRRIEAVIPLYINDTNDKNEKWTLRDMLEFLEIDEVITPSQYMFDLKAWFIQSYRILRELRITDRFPDGIEESDLYTVEAGATSGGLGRADRAGWVWGDDEARAYAEGATLANWMNGDPEGIASTAVHGARGSIHADKANQWSPPEGHEGEDEYWWRAVGASWIGKNSGEAEIIITPDLGFTFTRGVYITVTGIPEHDGMPRPDHIVAMYPPTTPPGEDGHYYTYQSYLGTIDTADAMSFLYDFPCDDVEIESYMGWTGVVESGSYGRYLTDRMTPGYVWQISSINISPYLFNGVGKDGLIACNTINFKFESRKLG